MRIVKLNAKDVVVDTTYMLKYKFSFIICKLNVEHTPLVALNLVTSQPDVTVEEPRARLAILLLFLLGLYLHCKLFDFIWIILGRNKTYISLSSSIGCKSKSIKFEIYRQLVVIVID